MIIYIATECAEAKNSMHCKKAQGDKTWENKMVGTESHSKLKELRS